MEKDFIESNGEKIYFYVQRKNIKNIKNTLSCHLLDRGV